MPQTLEVFQSMWAMEQRRPDQVEWPLAQKFEMIAEAGFQGVGLDFALNDLQFAKDCLPYLQQYNLACVMIAFPTNTKSFAEIVDFAKDFDTRFVAINARYFPWTPAEAVAQVEAWLALGENAGIPAYLETHRLTLTNDVVFTLDLMDLIPELELVADLSHILVAREFPEPIDSLSSELIERILQRSASIQGRIGSREQIQIPLGFAQHQYWESLFSEWWQFGFGCWRQNNAADATLNFLCELGPAPYAITDRAGYELSDRWQEALVLKHRAEEIWASTHSASQSSPPLTASHPVNQK